MKYKNIRDALLADPEFIEGVRKAIIKLDVNIALANKSKEAFLTMKDDTWTEDEIKDFYDKQNGVT